jgi:type IV pilus assembly protein PilB
VLIGEIRDHETGQIAVEAALTGHVLSTLHTNDAIAVSRVNGHRAVPGRVGAGRRAGPTARPPLSQCKGHTRPRQVPGGLRFPWEDGKPLPELFRPVGCTNCSKTGYKGRLALHEVMLISEEIERLAVEKASATTIEHVAREQGMKTLREDGLSKVLAGVTSLDEILRVVV